MSEDTHKDCIIDEKNGDRIHSFDCLLDRINALMPKIVNDEEDYR